MLREIENIITRYKRGLISEKDMAKTVFEYAEMMYTECFKGTAQERITLSRSDFKKLYTELKEG